MDQSICGSFEEIILECVGEVTWLTLSRPKALNAFTPRMVEEIDSALNSIEGDQRVRVLVLTGAGNAFCAGGDIETLKRDFGGGPEDGRARWVRRLGEVLCRLERLPIPTIAAVNGAAIGGGFEILLCADYVLAADTAQVGDGHSKYGMIPGGGSTARLPRLIGKARAKYLLFTGRVLPAAEMARLGVIQEVVAGAELNGRVKDICTELLARSSLGLRRVKQLVDDGMEMSLNAALASELLASELHAKSDDMTEGLNAFLERRQPSFRGC